MTVTELARRAGVTADTVRHYTRSGFLTPTRDKNNGYKCYNDGHLARLLFIRKARSLGFGLEDVSEIMKKSGHGHSPCPQVRMLIEQHLQENRLKLQDMVDLQTRMEHAVALWAHMPDGVPDGNAICDLIEKFSMED